MQIFAVSGSQKSICKEDQNSVICILHASRYKPITFLIYVVTHFVTCAKCGINSDIIRARKMRRIKEEGVL